jgi:hypothetical protein
MTAKIKLNAASGGGSFSLQAPSSSANTRVMTLPDTADGTILTTTNPKSGNILQVKQAVKTDTSSTTNTGWVTIPGTDESGSGSLFEVNITPSATSSKILVSWGIHLSVSSAVYSGGMKLRRNTTDIFIGDTSSSRTRATNWVVGWNQYADRHPWFLGGTFLDSPNTTSAVTYSFQYQSGYDGGYTVYINRPHSLFTDDVACGVVPSSITCMEVAA